MVKVPRLLQVSVAPVEPDWQWIVSDQEVLVMSGRSKTQADAQYEGDCALFEALSSGFFPDPKFG